MGDRHSFDAVPAAVWEGQVLTSSGERVPATRLAYSRWRETEVHHVDLGLGYGPADWPADLVDRMLPDLLADRADRRALAAWALGRAAPPGLGSWG